MRTNRTSPKGWNDFGLDGTGPLQIWLRCAFTAENVTRVLPVQTQRRCSSKGSSVDSSRGVSGSPAVSRIGSIVWVAPKGSCVGLAPCRGAGGVSCKTRERVNVQQQTVKSESNQKQIDSSAIHTEWRFVSSSQCNQTLQSLSPRF